MEKFQKCVTLPTRCFFPYSTNLCLFPYRTINIQKSPSSACRKRQKAKKGPLVTFSGGPWGSCAGLMSKHRAIDCRRRRRRRTDRHKPNDGAHATAACVRGCYARARIELLSVIFDSVFVCVKHPLDTMASENK